MQALFSVFDKEGIVELAKEVVKAQGTIISTGGTAKKLTDEHVANVQVSDITKFPELLDGRVKTLHPGIHAGLLARTELPAHVKELEQHNIKPIQLVVVNLYPFEDTIKKPNVSLEEALEMVDIGGVAILRAAAKNFANVVVLVDPKDYAMVVAALQNGGLQTLTKTQRKALAVKAFKHVAQYDTTICQYLGAYDFKEETPSAPIPTCDIVPRAYQKQFDLKYGVNPHQKPASVLRIKGHDFPFKVVNGQPGYINLLDALNAWQLVKELREATGLPAAASFKHVSPAGAGIAVPFTDTEKEVYELQGKELTPTAIAYLRARNADPMCSFGDFAAVSDIVDEATAMTLKTEVSDGIIAPGYSDKALEILKQKKNGGYIIIQADPNFVAPNMEYREVYGVALGQQRNHEKINDATFKTVVTKENKLTPEAIRDMIVATITLKYTQSNSVGYAVNGQMIGVGAGQQSRVDCTKLAGRKVENWWFRFHPKVRSLPFKPDTKKVDRTNTRVHYIENMLEESDLALLTSKPEPLSAQEKEEFLKTLKGVSCSSDAFFPFRDSIDVMTKYGVTYVAQPGGSVQDKEVISAASDYNMTMTFTNLRLFHH